MSLNSPVVPAIKIPYDSFVLSAIEREIAEHIGGRIQDIRQPNDHEVILGIYSKGKEHRLLLSCHPVFCRAHFVTRRTANQLQPPGFLSALRAKIDGGRLVKVEQIRGDRILEMTIEGEEDEYRLVVELMGRHANLILIAADGRIVFAAKWVGKHKSKRPIQANQLYELPPVMGDGGSSSPFFRRLEAEVGTPLKIGSPVYSAGHGAYPTSVAALGLEEVRVESLSIGLERHFSEAIVSHEVESLRTSLRTQLERVVLARDVALSELRQVAEAGGKAPEWQRLGELILAYGASAVTGQSVLTVWDYDGTERTLSLDPTLDFKENANRYFDRAKRAKGRIGMVKEQLYRLSVDRDFVAGLLARVESAQRLTELRDLHTEANGRRYLTAQPTPGQKKEDRPYEGHRIRELMAPGGWRVLYGENADANDYLSLRVAKSNDWWLHVRGSTSSHVIIQTQNQPERVQRDALEFAARVAIQHSPSKHGGFVPVDYTLKKYVRRPRGADKGSVVYTHEKTLHIEG